MKNNIISIYSNDTPMSSAIAESLINKFRDEEYYLKEEFDEDSELLICIGGDGVILNALHTYDFPQLPIIGINTGHLGFFQEVDAHLLDDFVYNYLNGKYRLQPLSMIEATVNISDGTQHHLRALNEIVIRGFNHSAAHLGISIDGSFIEQFTGDGILIGTSSGSTAYNYSLGGSIVDPRLNLLQVTPIAPMNTTAYRSFTSSILLPYDLDLEIVPHKLRSKRITITNDGIFNVYSGVSGIKASVVKNAVNLLRLDTYDFWNKVKTKLL